MQYEAAKSDLRFTGKVVGDTLQGTTWDDVGKPDHLDGKRAPASTPIKTVNWGAPVQLLAATGLEGWKQRSTEKGTAGQSQNGVLTNTPPCADLISDKTFGDFKVHVGIDVSGRQQQRRVPPRALRSADPGRCRRAARLSPDRRDLRVPDGRMRTRRNGQASGRPTTSRSSDVA